MSEFQRTAIVTGGARGIGRAISEKLAMDGLCVCVADKDKEAADLAAARIKATGMVYSLQVDVSSRSSIERMFAEASSQMGNIDVLICNAGIMDRAPFLDMHDDFWDRVLEVNLGGVFKCGQIAARRMIEQGKGGRIVNVASNSGVFGGRGRAACFSMRAPASPIVLGTMADMSTPSFFMRLPVSSANFNWSAWPMWWIRLVPANEITRFRPSLRKFRLSR